MEKQIRILAGVLVLFAFIISSCSDQQKKYLGIPVSEFYNNCQQIYDFGESITIGDPNDKFMITLPYSWDIREYYTDTLYGMIASPHPQSETYRNGIISFAVIGYQSNSTLEEYYRKEVGSLISDESMELSESGFANMGDLPARWIIFITREGSIELVHLVLYIKNPYAEEIFHLLSIVTKSEGYREYFCRLKVIANSFEFVE
ncbi:MAG: hypothetical protein K8R53_10295 [Bacteroidales bacterium]|nr:hypothetical protein [Bacteroidales bacterium]